MNKKLYYSLILVIFIIQITQQRGNLPPQKSLGINMGQISPHGPLFMFSDLFKQSESFKYFISDDSINWNPYDSSSLVLDSNGYPTNLIENNPNVVAGTVLTIPNQGQYLLIYEGAGEVKLNVYNSEQQNYLQTSDDTANRKVYTTTQDNLKVYVIINSLPVSKISIVEDSLEDTYESTDVFNPDLLLKISNFQVLRVCGLQNQKERHVQQEILEWENRTKKSQQQYHNTKGIAWEYIIELAEKNNSDLWICSPINAEEGYDRQLAQLLKDNLSQSKRIYIQFGFDLWLDERQATGMNNIVTPVYTEIFGEDRRNSQLLFVAYATRNEYFPHIESYFNKDFSNIDVFAASGQFGNPSLQWNSNAINLEELNQITQDQIYEKVKESVYNSLLQFNKDKNRIEFYGMKMVAFDGGLELSGPKYGYKDRFDNNREHTDGKLTTQQQAEQETNFVDKLKQFYQDERIIQLTTDYIKRWQNLGGSTFIAEKIVDSIQPRNESSISLLNSLQDPNTTPKYKGYLEYFADNDSTLPYTSADISLQTPVQCDPSCIWGQCINGTCKCYNGYSGDTCETLNESEKPNYCTNNISINIDGISDWSSEHKFVDVFKSSRQWVTQQYFDYTWDTEKLDEITLDEQGYPTQLPNNVYIGSIMLRDLEGHYEPGIYTVLYDGDGLLDFEMSDVQSVKWVQPGKFEVELYPQTSMNNGLFLSIKWTNPNDPIKNIRVIRPGYAETYLQNFFFPPFLQNIERYSTIRYMDYLNTNSQKDTTWDLRIKDDYRTFTVNGGSYESIIKLSNILGTNAWICIPHLADDEYVTNLANLLKDNLRPDIQVYIEYSNEVWGTLFDGGQYAQAQGLLENLSEDPNIARFCYLSKRTKEILEIFKTVYGNRDKFKLIISSQSVNWDVTDKILNCPNNEIYQDIDYLGIAPYFSTSMFNSTNNDHLNNYELLMDILLEQAIDQTIEYVQEQKTFLESDAKYSHIKLIAYESGQHLVESDFEGTAQAIKANRDPRMKNLYTQYLSDLKQNGLDEIALFTSVGQYSKYGSWGLKENLDQNQNQAYKHIAVQEYILSSGTCSDFIDYFNCPSDCNNQGQCLQDNTCYCDYGFQSDDCSQLRYVDFKECGYKCTFDQGTCELKDTVDQYERYYGCNCLEDYEGIHCGISLCQDNCNFNGKCSSESLQCECYEGFMGENCEIDCGCNGHGTCDTQTQQCICEEGFKFDTQQNQCVFDCKCRHPSQKCVSPGVCDSLFQCVNGVSLYEECYCYSGFTGRSCEEQDTQYPNVNSPTGINLNGISDWSTSYPFIDFFKMARPWISQNAPGYYDSDEQYIWDNKKPIDLDENGWVKNLSEGQSVGTLILRDVEQKVRNGIFVLLYEGSGQIDVHMDATEIKRTKGRIEFSVELGLQRDNGIYITITKIDPSNYIRNIRVIRKENEFIYEKFPFNSIFIENLKRFSGIRFMNWQSIHHSQLENWSDRKQKTYAFQSGGVAIEYMVELANFVGANPWFCIQHKANDDYIEKFAQYLKENVRQDLKIYIEYSNEFWNPLFNQPYGQEMAEKLGLENSSQFYALRSSQIFDIFEQVFGSKDRLIFVIGTQVVNTWISNEILSFQDTYKKADVLGVGAYFTCDRLSSPQNAPNIVNMSLDEIFERCENSIDSDLQSVIDQTNLMNEKFEGLPLINYESGPALLEQIVIENPNVYPTLGATEKFIEVHRSPKMRILYEKVLHKYRELMPSQPGFHFVLTSKCSKYGCWGAKEYQTQPDEDAPKYQALMDFITEVSGFEYKKKGCMDDQALNFDVDAIEPLNNCVYPPKEISKEQGGNINVKNKLQMVFPPNYHQQNIKIEYQQTQQIANSVGEAFKFGPPGTQFEKPIEVCFKIQENLDQNELKFCSSSDGLRWNCQDVFVQQDRPGYVCGKLSHFTQASIFQANNLPEDEFLPGENINDNNNDENQEKENAKKKEKQDFLIVILFIILGTLVLIIIVGSVYYYFYKKNMQKKVEPFKIPVEQENNFTKEQQFNQSSVINQDSDRIEKDN